MAKSGVLNILKPPAMTSHDVVQALRKILKMKRVGHTGTLDPDAIGVLPICFGQATRLAEYLVADQKTYRAVLTFGCETDTQDSSGEVIRKTSLPDISLQEFKDTLDSFVGEIEQIPPMYSAIKLDGQALYKLARQGQVVSRKPRTILIKEINVLEFGIGQATLEIICGKGTYIRTLCKDIAAAVASSGHMSFLIRTKSGIFTIDKAYTLEEVKSSDLEQILIKPALALDLPEIIVGQDLEFKIKNGNKLPLSYFQTGLIDQQKYKIVDHQGELLAISSSKDGFLRPEKVFG